MSIFALSASLNTSTKKGKNMFILNYYKSLRMILLYGNLPSHKDIAS